MIYLDINQAKSNLIQLLDLAVKGQEITITQNKIPVAKLSPAQNPSKQGGEKETIWDADILDESLVDLQKT